MSRDWASLRNMEAVRARAAGLATRGDAPSAVRSAAVAAGLTCSEFVDETIHCSVPAPDRLPLMRSTWLIRFRFRNGARGRRGRGESHRALTRLTDVTPPGGRSAIERTTVEKRPTAVEAVDG